MKRSALWLITLVFGLEAQELVTKKGFKILPEKKDYAISFNAVPVLDFALNLANIAVNTGQTAQNPSYVTGLNQVFVGKYFLEDNKALRALVGINHFINRNVQYGKDPHDILANPGNPDAWNEIKDIHLNDSTAIFLGAGLEWRRGHNRLQGFYGVEGVLQFQSQKVKNTWGVTMDSIAIANGFTNLDGSALNGRILLNKTGISPGLFIRSFIGVEYFVLPKISIGAEFGWGLGALFTPRGKTTIEQWDAAAKQPKEKTNEGNLSGRRIAFMVDDGIAGSALNLTFHF